MAHAISVQNGVAEIFSGNNKLPWHGLGQVVSGLLTSREAIEAAHLGWQALSVPVTVNDIVLPIEDYQGIVRSDTGATLGITKGRYEIIQNGECFEFMDSLAAEGHIKYETAGALRGGKLVWMLAKYDGEIKICNDSHEQWLLLVTSHDGSRCLELCWVTVRVVCANTLSIALNGKRNSVKIRHSTNWMDKRAEAQRILGLTQKYFGTIQEALAGMNDRLLSPEEMAEFTKILTPSKDEDKVPTKTQNVRDEINKLFSQGAGNKGLSRWDALNAVTDYADHSAVLRGPNSTRLESAVFGSGAELKQRAYDLLTSEDIMGRLLEKPIVPTLTTTGDDFGRLVTK